MGYFKGYVFGISMGRSWRQTWASRRDGRSDVDEYQVLMSVNVSLLPSQYRPTRAV